MDAETVSQRPYVFVSVDRYLLRVIRLQRRFVLIVLGIVSPRCRLNALSSSKNPRRLEAHTTSHRLVPWVVMTFRIKKSTPPPVVLEMILCFGTRKSTCFLVSAHQQCSGVVSIRSACIANVRTLGHSANLIRASLSHLLSPKEPRRLL
jgi:hypothetical protein